MFVVLGPRQKGKTEHLIQELARVTYAHETVRYIVRQGSVDETTRRVKGNPHIKAMCVVDFNASVSIPIVPVSHELVTDYLVIDAAEKSDPESLLKLLKVLSSIEEELGSKILVAIQTGFDVVCYRNVIGEPLVDTEAHTYIWLN
jgi:thymidine kinase